MTLVASDKNSIENPRKPRIISFDTSQDDIAINLDFSFPFLKIPLNKNFNSAFGVDLGLPKINFNPSTLALGGAMVLVTSLFATAFSNKGFLSHNYNRRYDRKGDSDYVNDVFLGIANTVMSNSHSCPSRIACWASRRSSKDSLRTWKQITRNKLLTTMFNTTAVENAFVIGRNGGDCESFTPCPIEEDQFAQIMNHFSKLAHSRHIPPSV